MGEFQVDFIVEDLGIVENKAVQTLATAHEVQLVNYLRATRKDFGLLLNFGASSLQFKRKHRVYKLKEPNQVREYSTPQWEYSTTGLPDFQDY